MNTKFEDYWKFHAMTMSYSDAEKYMKLGWKLESMRRVFLRGINKEYEECVLVWEKNNSPVIPDDLDLQK